MIRLSILIVFIETVDSWSVISMGWFLFIVLISVLNVLYDIYDYYETHQNIRGLISRIQNGSVDRDRPHIAHMVYDGPDINDTSYVFSVLVALVVGYQYGIQWYVLIPLVLDTVVSVFTWVGFRRLSKMSRLAYEKIEGVDL